MTACVFPEFGSELARALATDGAKLRPFRSLEGVPQSIRMVPASIDTGVDPCASEGELLVPSGRWSTEFLKYEPVSTEAFYCGLFGRDSRTNAAADAVWSWFYIHVGRGFSGDRYAEELARGGWGRRGRAAAMAMGELPTEAVIARLGSVWSELRRARLPIEHLAALMES